MISSWTYTSFSQYKILEFNKSFFDFHLSKEMILM